jgi:hypothetical protein
MRSTQCRKNRYRFITALNCSHDNFARFLEWHWLSKLLALAQAEFNVFLTADRNLSFQQNTTKFQIAVVVLLAGITQLNKTLPLMSKVLALLPGLTPGQIAIVSSQTHNS